MSLHKEIHTITIDDKPQEIQISISYSKNVGYRVTVIPIRRTQGEGFTLTESGAFTGFIDTLLIVGRQSDKRFKQAIEIFNSRLSEYLEAIELQIIRDKPKAYA